MIEVKGLSKKLKNFQLDNLSFTIPTGYICGLIGQNGAGKTTLLHLLLGLYQADEGEVLIDGMTYANEEKRIHNKIGAVLTEELFDASLTLIQNGDAYGRYYDAYDKKAMEDYLELFGLEKNRKFGRLSKGEKLKCQFAFALSYDARLLILDEPTGNFDPEFREQFFKILKEFIADGSRSVVLATHLTEDLDCMADYLIYLEKGKQVFAGDIEAFRDSYRMVSGEAYKIKLLHKEKIIHMEENSYGAKALVAHSRLNYYDRELRVVYPSIEEFMYFYTGRKEGQKGK